MLIIPMQASEINNNNNALFTAFHVEYKYEFKNSQFFAQSVSSYEFSFLKYVYCLSITWNSTSISVC